MDLSSLDGVNIRTIGILQKNGWTIDTLATTSVQKLAVIPGISLKSATEAIRASRKVINIDGLRVAKKEEYNPLPDGPLQRSVRVRRIYGEKV